jgi:hypothetical protein
MPDGGEEHERRSAHGRADSMQIKIGEQRGRRKRERQQTTASQLAPSAAECSFAEKLFD